MKDYWSQFEEVKQNTLDNQDYWSQFEEIDNNIQTNQQTPTPMGQRIASGAKSFVAGYGGGVVDTVGTAYNLGAMGYDALYNSDTVRNLRNAPDDEPMHRTPLAPSLTDAISDGIDSLTGGYTNTPEEDKYLNEGLKFAGSVASGGALAKGAAALGIDGVAKFGNAVGSLKPSHIVAGGVAGRVGSEIADVTDDEVTGAVAGLTAGIATNAIANRASIGTKLAQVGKQKLNADTLKAGKEIGINIPAQDTIKEDVAGTFFQKIFKRFENNFKDKTIPAKASERINQKAIEILDKAYDATLPTEALDSIKTQIKEAYNKATSMAPNVPITASKTLSVAQEIVDIQKQSPFKTDIAKQVLNDANELLTGFQNQNNSSSVNGLVIMKKNIYDQIGNFDTDKTVKNVLKQYSHAIEEDLKSFSSTSKEAKTWYEQYKIADRLHQRNVQRTELDNLFKASRNDAQYSKIQDVNNNINYNSLAKVLRREDTKELLQEIATPSVVDDLHKLQKLAFEEVEKLQKTSAGLTKIKMNEFPEDTNLVMRTLDTAKQTPIAGVLINLVYDTTNNLGKLLVTNKELLEQSIKLAENQTKSNFAKFNQAFKSYIGYTPYQALNMSVEKAEVKPITEEDKKSTKEFFDGMNESSIFTPEERKQIDLNSRK